MEEKWIIYHDASYEAVPWPFSVSWGEFIEHPEPLVYTAHDFGRVSPSDGFGGIASTPPHLPRELPRGKYRMAIYHDHEYIYTFIETEPPPPVPGLQPVKSYRMGLGLLSADARYGYYFTTDQEEEKGTLYIIPNIGGSRQVPKPSNKVKWDCTVMDTAKGILGCWRILRADIAAAFRCDTLQLSLMCMWDPAMEAVAWGSHLWWLMRIDEMGTVHLVGKRERPPWPIVRRVDMTWDPAKELATLRVHWEARYEPGESLGLDEVYGHKYFEEFIPIAKFLLRVNGVEDLLGLDESAEVVLKDGKNFVEIAAVAGPPVRFHFEKYGGARIIESPYPPQPEVSRSRIASLIRRACEAYMETERERRERGASRSYDYAVISNTAGLARVYHYFDQDTRFLDLIREEAEFTLTLQREDGALQVPLLPGIDYKIPEWFGGSYSISLDDGTFRHAYVSQEDKEQSPPWSGGAYDAGRVGELWIAAYRLLGDDKFMDASRKLVGAYSAYRLEYNQNFAAFALWHLVEHYRLTREPLALDHALYYAQAQATRGITPCGFQGGHNYYTCYGEITLRALASLCAVLPDDMAYKKTLREYCVRMGNQLISRLQPDGVFGARCRMLIGMKGGWQSGLFQLAFLVGPEDVRRIDAIIQHMLRIPAKSQSEQFWTNLLFLGDLCRYLAYREALLGGNVIDPFELV